MSAPVDADAREITVDDVWTALEPLGWTIFRYGPNNNHAVFTSPPEPMRWQVRVQFHDFGQLRIEDFIHPAQYHIIAPALAALSRLLGGTGHAAPELGEGE